MCLLRILALCIFLLAPSPLHAALFSVATVAELEAALATAEINGEDDTITIAAGRYSLTASLNYDSHEDKSITITGAPGGEVILDIGSWNRILFVRTYTANAAVTIRGITCTNGYVPEYANGAGIFINIANSDLVLENLQVTNCFAGAMYGNNHGGGAYITAGLGANVLMRNCVISNNTAKGLGGGIYLSVIDGNAILINNTIIFNKNKASIVEQGGGIYLRLFYTNAVAKLYNNILWGNTYAHGDGDLYVEDNGDKILDDTTGASIYLYNNNYKQFDYNTLSSSSVTLVDNTHLDPLFSSDYHLSVDSPCVDGGHSGAPDHPDFDIDGDFRSLDGNCDGNALPDMGADEYLLLPTVSSSTITEIGSTTASGGGNIMTEGGHPVTAKGVCWNTTAQPTLADSCSNDGAGSAAFSSYLSGLSEGMSYYVRAYATTCEGSSYSEQESFIAGASSGFPWLLFLPALTSGSR